MSIRGACRCRRDKEREQRRRIVSMEFMLVLYEDPELVATEQQRKEAVQRVGEYAMGLVGDGTLKGGAPLHPVAEAKKGRTRDGPQRSLDGPLAKAKEAIAGDFVIEA